MSQEAAGCAGLKANQQPGHSAKPIPAMRSHSRNRVARLKTTACWLLVLALLGATSQYLAHFHVQPASAATAQVDDASGHPASGHCTLCVQFDRLPAPPAAASAPEALYFLASDVDTSEAVRPALDAPHLWPPARAPPALTC
jgi:hypothetical protein